MACVGVDETRILPERGVAGAGGANEKTAAADPAALSYASPRAGVLDSR